MYKMGDWRSTRIFLVTVVMSPFKLIEAAKSVGKLARKATEKMEEKYRQKKKKKVHNGQLSK